MSKYLKILLGLLGITILLNILAFSKGFCDFYADYIYVHIANGYGWLTNKLPFSMGEIVMYFAVLLLFLTVVLIIAYFFLKRKEKARLFIKNYMKTMSMFVAITLFLYTILWLIPFRGTSIEAQLDKKHSYSTKELIRCRNYVVNQLNAIAEKIERDEEGHIIYSEDAESLCRDALKEVAKEYPRLRGHYPTMKKAFCSDFLEWMDIGGYTYPYTMEITGNRYVTRMYYPTLYVHEMAHHKGYYKESDANFISFLVCSSSEDLRLQYSAYLDMYYYLDNEYFDYVCEVNTEAVWEEYDRQPMLSNRVEKDMLEVDEEGEEAYEEGVNPVLEEKVSTYAEDVAKVGWETQAEILKEDNYDGVVRMILEYYDGILY